MYWSKSREDSFLHGYEQFFTNSISKGDLSRFPLRDLVQEFRLDIPHWRILLRLEPGDMWDVCRELEILLFETVSR